MGAAYRIVAHPYGGSVASMRGAVLYGGRYNIRGHFGALYAALREETARREVAQYYTRPPLGGFVRARIELRLNRVLDLRDRQMLRRIGVTRGQLTQPSYMVTQEIGLRAWECGFEGLIAPSAVAAPECSVAAFLDNQSVSWRIRVAEVSPLADLETGIEFS